MKWWQTLEHLAYWNIPDTYYNGTLKKNVFQHIRTVGSQGAPIQQGQLELEVWINLWHVLPKPEQNYGN